MALRMGMMGIVYNEHLNGPNKNLGRKEDWSSHFENRLITRVKNPGTGY